MFNLSHVSMVKISNGYNTREYPEISGQIESPFLALSFFTKTSHLKHSQLEHLQVKDQKDSDVHAKV